MNEELNNYVVVQGDAKRLPLPDASVDLVVTSPPYFSQRSYEADNPVGSEATPEEYLEALWTSAAEMKRVVKPTGSIFVNLGDKYQDKTLLGLPWRFALGCKSLKLLLRAELIWAKPNGLPDPTNDRVGRSHEHWFHLVKTPRYFANVDALREPHATGDHHLKYPDSAYVDGRKRGQLKKSGQNNSDFKTSLHPLGKVPGSVWSIATEPLKTPPSLGVDHFAAFPTEIPRRLVLGWCPEGGTVLDPFGGTGTTALVADALGRVGISLDLSHGYCRLAEWRINESGHGKKALSRTWSERQGGLAV